MKNLLFQAKEREIDYVKDMYFIIYVFSENPGLFIIIAQPAEAYKRRKVAFIQNKIVSIHGKTGIRLYNKNSNHIRNASYVNRKKFCNNKERRGIMKYRKLGKWGLKVSEVALGSWLTDLSDSAAVETARECLKLAYEGGVNFFDCADGYNGGGSEKFFGEALKDYPRSSYVISSKVFFPVGPGVNDRGLSRKHIFEQIDRSLKNMRTDYLDLYFCHRYDPDTPLEETLQALSDLVQQGKILYYGVSEWSPVQITEALGIIKEKGLRPLSVIQPQYNMMDRYIEDEIMGICEENGIGIVPFSPLSQGLLTGKYRKGQPIPEGSRATHQADKQINKLLTEENLDKVEKLIKVAEKCNVKMSVLALAWILRKKQISSVITGASKPSQVEGNLMASGLELPQEILDEIEEILDYHPFFRKIG